ncbi:MAG TPA: hypothetical protein VH234_03730 [Candidatus Saccharimonadales bacterium]|jgi:hypothetical protein|nr:hypothetical protein [Candidatus Saccharimonadales bacterium]
MTEEIPDEHNQAKGAEPTVDDLMTLSGVRDEPYPQPSDFAEGAEGVATFEGYSEANGHERARDWVNSQWAKVSAQIRQRRQH